MNDKPKCQHPQVSVRFDVLERQYAELQRLRNEIARLEETATDKRNDETKTPRGSKR